MNDRQRATLNSLLEGAPMNRQDGRVLNALRRKRLVDQEGVTLSGYHALGRYKNRPSIPLPDADEVAKWAGRGVLVSETFEKDYDEAAEDEVHYFEFSADLLIDAHTRIIEAANEYLEAHWDQGFDRQVEDGTILKSAVPFMVERAFQASEIKLDFVYTGPLVRRIAEEMLAKGPGRFESANLTPLSRKCSFTDTDWEAEAISWAKFKRDAEQAASDAGFRRGP